MSQEWYPILDYETEPKGLADKELRALSGVWVEQRSKLSESDNISKFTERLKREWAIETGLIERLYTLDHGITELMIERGVNAALIPRHVADDPGHIVAMIDDQENAVESVFAFVKGDRQLSTSYVKELHQVFTRHQEFVEGRDPSGRKVQVPLIRGDYKRQPNNPTRPDGTIHPYCPPEQVASEMDSLIELHRNHHDVAPEVEAAWLHHRFTQIHPFQDGNGRIARALATLIFVKADWLPLVVRDSERDKYIGALEEADRGNLKPLVSFFAGLQKREFVNALGIARGLEKDIRVNARIQAIGQRLAQRRDALVQEWRAAMANAEHLHTLAKERMNEVCSSLEDALSDHHDFTFSVDDEGNRGERSHYFQRQIVSTAKQLGYYANTRDYRSWVRLIARGGGQGNILITFHCIGHEFRGVLVCSGTWFQRVPTDDGGSESEGETALCDEVFQINYKEDIADTELRFRDWIESAVERGLALWESSTL